MYNPQKGGMNKNIQIRILQQSYLKNLQVRKLIIICYIQVQENVNFVLASSGSDKGSSAKECVKLHDDKSQMQATKSPLAGINIDILHMQQMAKKRQLDITIVQTSKYKNKLLSRKTIIQKISNYFIQANGKHSFTTFYFTGHGYFEGAMVIQTEQHPDGQPLYIQQIYDLRQKAHSKESIFYLDIYLDCCYSGKMAARLKNNRQLREGYNIMLCCSSGPSHTSFDVNHYGGLLICSEWSSHLNGYLLEKEKKQLKQLFQSRLPISMASCYYNGDTRNWGWGDFKPITF